MATVFLARDLRHERRVAFKVLNPELGAVLGAERFLSEIRVTANLQHPNLLPLFDSGETDGLLYYVMPFVEGESLRARLERERQLPVDEAIRMAVLVADALDYAHGEGVIHRDLKPENILLSRGQPLVADFGIALAVSLAGGARVTQTGLSLGTPQYMSPEQATGDRTIDSRTDIYSLGAVTYEMLTGEAPHSGTTAQAIIARLLTEHPRQIRSQRPTVTEQMEAAVERALEKLPADRWATAKEFSEALTGTRVVVRTSRTAAFAAASVGPSGRTAAETADFSIIGSRRITVREIAAWSLAAVALVAFGSATLRRDEPERLGVATEFEIELPDSVEVSGGGSAAAIALSRDGSTLVFNGARAGESPSLWLRYMDQREVVPLRGADSTRGPVFSNDGSEVLFSYALGGRGGRGGGGGGGGGGRGGRGVGRASAPIMRIATRGGTPRPLTDSAAGNGQLSWGQGGRIVFAADDGLFVMSSPGGAATFLAAPDSSRGHVRYGFPDLLPGGKAALLVIWKGVTSLDSAVIGVVTIPGGKVTELGIRGTYPRYSTTGHLLVATRDAQLVAVPFSTRSLQITGEAVVIVENVAVGSGGAAGYAISDNGTLVYHLGTAAANGARDLVAVDRKGAERELGLNQRPIQWPRVSPDGDQVAIAVATSLDQVFPYPDIHRFEIKTRRLVRVTTDSASIVSAWTHDNSRIVAGKTRVAGVRGADSVITIRPLYSAGLSQTLMRFGSDTSVVGFAFGPARGYASVMVFPTSGNSDIWLAHIDSLGSPRPFLTQPYREWAGRVSPDGNLLAYVTDSTGRQEVYVRPISGRGVVRRVSLDEAREPVWNREGRELFFRSGGNMMVAQISGSTDLTVARYDTLFLDSWFLTPFGSAPQYDVMPGGREFVMLRRPQQLLVEIRPLIAVMNWPARLRGPRK